MFRGMGIISVSDKISHGGCAGGMGGSVDRSCPKSWLNGPDGLPRTRIFLHSSNVFGSSVFLIRKLGTCLEILVPLPSICDRWLLALSFGTFPRGSLRHVVHLVYVCDGAAV